MDFLKQVLGAGRFCLLQKKIGRTSVSLFFFYFDFDEICALYPGH